MKHLIILLFISTLFAAQAVAQVLVTDETSYAMGEQLIDCEWLQGQPGVEVSLGSFPVEDTGTGYRCSLPFAQVTQNVGVVDNFIVIPRNFVGPGPASAAFQSITVAPSARSITGWQ